MGTTADKAVLLIHSNCQGEPLRSFLGRLPGVAERYEIRLVENYLREPLPDELLSRCQLFLYHRLPNTWGELSTESVLARLPASCDTLSFPSMFFGGYWPFWGHSGDGEFPDTLMDSLVAKRLPLKEIKRIYLRSNVVPAHDFQELFKKSLDREYAKQQFTPIHHVERMLEGYQQRMTFHTANHPGHDLLCWLGGQIVRHLGWELPQTPISELMPELHPEFRLPIHPLVGEAMGLQFAGWETRYPVYGRMLTFEDYVDEYLLAKANGINEFISFLRVRAEQGEAAS